MGVELDRFLKVLQEVQGGKYMGSREGYWGRLKVN